MNLILALSLPCPHFASDIFANFECLHFCIKATKELVTYALLFQMI